MALTVPPTNADGSLRYYTTAELAQIGFQLRGVSGEGDHTEETLSPGGNGVVRKYSCNWDERYAAALVLVGYAIQYQADGTGPLLISRLLPDRYDGLPNMNWACTAVTIHPFGYDGTVDAVGYGQPIPSFRRADLIATYEQVPYALLDDAETAAEFDRYVIRPGYPGADITSETTAITFPGGSGILNYTTSDGTTSPAGKPIPYGIGRSETLSNKAYVWKRVPLSVWQPGSPLYTMVKGDGSTDNPGYINSLNLTTFDNSYPPLTLKLVAVEERLLLDPLGLGYAWDLVYRMQERPVPYGHTGLLYYAAGGSVAAAYYQALVRGITTTEAAADIADGDALYNVREFANLFDPNGA